MTLNTIRSSFLVNRFVGGPPESLSTSLNSSNVGSGIGVMYSPSAISVTRSGELGFKPLRSQ